MSSWIARRDTVKRASGPAGPRYPRAGDLANADTHGGGITCGARRTGHCHATTLPCRSAWRGVRVRASGACSWRRRARAPAVADAAARSRVANPLQAAAAEHAVADAGLAAAPTAAAPAATGALRGAAAAAASAAATRTASGTWMGRRNRSVSWDDLPNKLCEAEENSQDDSTPEQRSRSSSIASSIDEGADIAVPRWGWQPDQEAQKCQMPGCERVFSMMYRRHHCRKCGRVRVCASLCVCASACVETTACLRAHARLPHARKDAGAHLTGAGLRRALRVGCVLCVQQAANGAAGPRR